jgi:hypothetical protein
MRVQIKAGCAKHGLAKSTNPAVLRAHSIAAVRTMDVCLGWALVSCPVLSVQRFDNLAAFQHHLLSSATARAEPVI